MKAEHIKPGALTIQLAGHECDFELVLQSRKRVTDSWDVMKHRGITTPAVMHAQGLLHDEDIHANLGQLTLGLKPGRENESERIHLFHIGMGVEDIAWAWQVYRTSCERGLGQWLDLWDKPLWT